MIELKNVRKSFGKKEAQVEALRGVTLTVREGEMAAVSPAHTQELARAMTDFGIKLA